MRVAECLCQIRIKCETEQDNQTKRRSGIGNCSNKKQSTPLGFDVYEGKNGLKQRDTFVFVCYRALKLKASCNLSDHCGLLSLVCIFKLFLIAIIIELNRWWKFQKQKQKVKIKSQGREERRSLTVFCAMSGNRYQRIFLPFSRRRRRQSMLSKCRPTDKKYSTTDNLVNIPILVQFKKHSYVSVHFLNSF